MLIPLVEGHSTTRLVRRTAERTILIHPPESTPPAPSPSRRGTNPWKRGFETDASCRRRFPSPRRSPGPRDESGTLSPRAADGTTKAFQADSARANRSVCIGLRQTRSPTRWTIDPWTLSEDDVLRGRPSGPDGTGRGRPGGQGAWEARSDDSPAPGDRVRTSPGVLDPGMHGRHLRPGHRDVPPRGGLPQGAAKVPVSVPAVVPPPPPRVEPAPPPPPHASGTPAVRPRKTRRRRYWRGSAPARPSSSSRPKRPIEGRGAGTARQAAVAESRRWRRREALVRSQVDCAVRQARKLEGRPPRWPWNATCWPASATPPRPLWPRRGAIQLCRPAAQGAERHLAPADHRRVP